MTAEVDELAALYAEWKTVEWRRSELTDLIAAAEERALTSIQQRQATRDSSSALGTRITLAVSEQCGVSPRFLLDRKRTADVVAARAVAYMVARKFGWSYPQIAEWVQRDHTTIINACNQYPELQATADRIFTDLAHQDAA